MQTTGDSTTASPRCRKVILVVDDDLDVRECIENVLEVAGYEVRTASNGREALERLAKGEPPSLILLDLMMPIMCGSEFLHFRSESEALARIPVVVASAWPNEAAKAEGTQGFIEKPISLDSLLKVVEECCAGDRASHVEDT